MPDESGSCGPPSCPSRARLSRCRRRARARCRSGRSKRRGIVHNGILLGGNSRTARRILGLDRRDLSSRVEHAAGRRRIRPDEHIAREHERNADGWCRGDAHCRGLPCAGRRYGRVRGRRQRGLRLYCRAGGRRDWSRDVRDVAFGGWDPLDNGCLLGIRRRPLRGVRVRSIRRYGSGTVDARARHRRDAGRAPQTGNMTLPVWAYDGYR